VSLQADGEDPVQHPLPRGLVDLEAGGGLFGQDHLFYAVSIWKLQVGAPEAFTVLLTPPQRG